MLFPQRFVTVSPPEYDDLKFQMLANPTGALYAALVDGSTVDEDGTPSETARIALGTALVQAYAGAVVEGYGYTFDFSTADAAVATVIDPALPVDLRFWLRNAPAELVIYLREDQQKKFQISLTTGD